MSALDLFVPRMLRPGALSAFMEIAPPHDSGKVSQTVLADMPPALSVDRGRTPAGYRRAGRQCVRLDMADKLLREAHGSRTHSKGRPFVIDPAKAISMGLTTASYTKLLRMAGFVPLMPKSLTEGVFGPPEPLRWRWRRPRMQTQAEHRGSSVNRQSAFAPLAELVR